MRRSMTIVAAASILVVAPPTAAASAAEEPPAAVASTSTLQPGRTVVLARDGTAVTWRVRITCPAGEPYDLTAVLDDLSTDAPYYDGGDRGVRAVLESGTATGTCTGRTQVVRFTAPVVDGPDGTFWPMSRGGWVNTFVELTTPSTSVFACQHAACASTTHDWKPRLR
ncbi:hypothetical protein [Kineococcus indalonis]|uniref:hypothetical protein n=1 Tax=Kineococcus indalonis TaxID=2696566 RepID=UPI001413291F|nr:hypothetical protein [Kineococcus indalonis]NAZ86917.1 hypothetical protein [Kineococcus indalonis]